MSSIANQADLPLQGVRVVDLTRNLAGPYCTMMLGDLGAEVIKVERPPTGDELRTLFPYPGRSLDAEDLFGMFNRNKLSVELDLKSEFGKRALAGLIAKSDIFVQNNAPGAVERLGFDYQTVSELNPAIVYVSISGFGAHDNRRAHDMIIQAASGVMDLTRAADGTPTACGLNVGDLAASLFAAFAAVSGLHQARTSGVGSNVEVAMFDSILALMSGATSSFLATGEYHTGSPARIHRVPTDSFRTADGRYILIMGSGEAWPRLCTALTLHSAGSDPRFLTDSSRNEHREEVTKIVGDRVGALDLDAVVEALSKHDVPHQVVASLSEALTSEQVARRGMILDIGEELRGDREPVRVMGFPYMFNDGRPPVRLGPPKLGQDNDYVLGELLGMKP